MITALQLFSTFLHFFPPFKTKSKQQLKRKHEDRRTHLEWVDNAYSEYALQQICYLPEQQIE